MRTLPPTTVSISVWGGSWLHLNKHIRDFLHEIFQQVFLETPGLWLELETDPDYHERCLYPLQEEKVNIRDSVVWMRGSRYRHQSQCSRGLSGLSIWLTVTLSLAPGWQHSGLTNQGPESQDWPIRDQNLVTWGQLTLLILSRTSLSRQSRDIRVTPECDPNINLDRK